MKQQDSVQKGQKIPMLGLLQLGHSPVVHPILKQSGQFPNSVIQKYSWSCLIHVLQDGCLQLARNCCHWGVLSWLGDCSTLYWVGCHCSCQCFVISQPSCRTSSKNSSFLFLLSVKMEIWKKTKYTMYKYMLLTTIGLLTECSHHELCCHQKIHNLLSEPGELCSV